MPRKGLKYLQHKEVAALVHQERWEDLHKREIETSRGTVRNSTKQLLSYAEIMEMAGAPSDKIAKLKQIATDLNHNTKIGRKKADIQNGHTREVRLNPKQGQALVPYCGAFFDYEEGSGVDADKKNPFKNQFIKATYKDNQIILTPMTKSEWEEHTK